MMRKRSVVNAGGLCRRRQRNGRRGGELFDDFPPAGDRVLDGAQPAVSGDQHGAPAVEAQAPSAADKALTDHTSGWQEMVLLPAFPETPFPMPETHAEQEIFGAAAQIASVQDSAAQVADEATAIDAAPVDHAAQGDKISFPASDPAIPGRVASEAQQSPRSGPVAVDETKGSGMEAQDGPRVGLASTEEMGHAPELGQAVEQGAVPAPSSASRPCDEQPEFTTPAAANQVPNSELITYSRRSRATPSSAATTPAANFLRKISKPAGSIMPAVAVQKRRKKSLPSDFVPRRSRRVAKLPPEAAGRAATTICRKLGLSDEERISEEALETYVRVFDRPLSRSHIAALFGWSAPSCDEVRPTEEIPAA